MQETIHTCPKGVDDFKVVKNGKSRNGKQRYKCMSCGKSFLTNYTNQAYKSGLNHDLTTLLKEGMGILSISRVLNISKNTVLNRIRRISLLVKRPMISQGKEYQLDEMCTFIGYKLNKTWIAYTIRRDTKEVIDFKVGKRTNKTLRFVIDALLLSHPSIQPFQVCS